MALGTRLAGEWDARRRNAKYREPYSTIRSITGSVLAFIWILRYANGT